MAAIAVSQRVSLEFPFGAALRAKHISAPSDCSCDNGTYLLIMFARKMFRLLMLTCARPNYCSEFRSDRKFRRSLCSRRSAGPKRLHNIRNADASIFCARVEMAWRPPPALPLLHLLCVRKMPNDLIRLMEFRPMKRVSTFIRNKLNRFRVQERGLLRR